MFARILKSGTFHDVVGYVTRQFHDPKEYTPEHGASSEVKKYFHFRLCEKWCNRLKQLHGFYARQGESGRTYFHQF